MHDRAARRAASRVPRRGIEAERGHREVRRDRAHATRVAVAAAVERLERVRNAPLRADDIGRPDAGQDGAIGLLEDPVEDLHPEEARRACEQDGGRHAPTIARRCPAHNRPAAQFTGTSQDRRSTDRDGAAARVRFLAMHIEPVRRDVLAVTLTTTEARARWWPGRGWRSTRCGARRRARCPPDAIATLERVLADYDRVRERMHEDR